MSRLKQELVQLNVRNSLNSNYSTKQAKSKGASHAFTIVELLIVVVVIAILAAITIVSYNGITKSAKETTLKSDLSTAAKQLQLDKVRTGSYPTNKDNLKTSAGTDFAYTPGTNTFCLQASSSSLPGKTFHITEAGSIEEGNCPIQIQTITNANCPTTRTVVIDARDNHTYFIQKLADGKCWMLTSLAYGGGTSNGGTNTYSDVIPTGNGTAGTLSNGTSDTAATYTEAKYYVHANASPSIHPNQPSTNNAGGGTAAGGERQYGYLYNWCAAMGAQSTTSACADATTPAPNTSISVCPAGWRLPTGEATTGEFTQLNNAINSGLTNSDAGLRSNWLAQLGGVWNGGFGGQGSSGYYWSASQASATSARSLNFVSSSVNPAGSSGKVSGRSVRCLAS